MIPASLNVLLYGEKIGAITYLGGDRSIFSFEESYIDNPSRPTLGLSFKSDGGELITDFSPTQTQLLPWFSNLLPEGPLRSYLAEQTGVKPVREYSLIAALGKDLPGAVQIVSSEEKVQVEKENVSDQSEAIPHNALKFSLAGVQLKFSALAKQKGGLTIPTQGIGGNWIVKLPSLRFEGLSQNEFSMMTLARLVGMDIPDFKLIPLSEIEGLPRGIEHIAEDAFAIRRFDRAKDGSLVHMEDFAQVYGVYPERKYERASAKSIATVLWIETGEKGVREFIKRLIFNTLIGNADMHLKNWSLLYPDRIHATLSPGYDFVSTIPYITDDSAALTYARTKKMAKLDKDELSYLASKSHIPEKLVIEEAMQTVETFLHVWNNNKKDLPLSRKLSEVIDNHLKSLALLNMK